MKHNPALCKIIIFVISFTLTLGCLISIYLATFSIYAVLIALSFITLLYLCAWSYHKCLTYETQSLYTEVSDMLENIINNKYTAAFPENQDDLLSKLQSQVEKLRNIYLSQAAKAQQERKEIQSLISDIAHQLKTPLANVKVYGDLLKSKDLTAEDRSKFTASLHNQLEKLTFLTESLIKMSRLESGVIQIKSVPCSLNETVMKSVNQAYQKAISKNITITLEKNDPVVLNHDSAWTAEAIFNLLDNAVKYTPAGGNIKIRIQSYELFARVDVEDNGIGVCKEDLNKIFNRFFRGKNAENTEGIGIGLYLTREIASLQGGYIKVNSGTGGSTFSVFLPLK